MTSKLFRVTITVVLVITAVSLISASAYAQARAANATANTLARTPDGQPKIADGVWNRRGVGGLDQGALEAPDHRPENPLDPTPANPLSVSTRADGLNNVDRGFLEQFSEKLGAGGDDDRPAPRGERRLMGIAEPGRILPWKPDANAARQAFLLKTNPAQGLKYVEMDARCMQPGLFFGNGPFQFLQTEGQVTILSEYQHFTRHIYLDGRPHLPKDIKMFMGDSIGRWEGNTLVVDTTNFNGITAYSREIPYLTDALRTTERFTLTNANTIDYEVTIDDPNQFTRPWKVTGQYTKADDLPELLEYACWEGSITLRNILGEPPRK
ncbi:MAG: hypothetical protein DMG13_00295 [Acidobacteria bacterium]|nr:MAG: hypothetical protein DMG13_00295 [Acidobacteriota bacterium]